jgi:hypothetical protein
MNSNRSGFDRMFCNLKNSVKYLPKCRECVKYLPKMQGMAFLIV